MEVWLLDGALALLGPALWSMACYRVREAGEKGVRTRQDLNFSIAQTDLAGG